MLYFCTKSMLVDTERNCCVKPYIAGSRHYGTISLYSPVKSSVQDSFNMWTLRAQPWGTRLLNVIVEKVSNLNCQDLVCENK